MTRSIFRCSTQPHNRTWQILEASTTTRWICRCIYTGSVSSGRTLWIWGVAQTAAPRPDRRRREWWRAFMTDSRHRPTWPWISQCRSVDNLRHVNNNEASSVTAEMSTRVSSLWNEIKGHQLSQTQPDTAGNASGADRSSNTTKIDGRTGRTDLNKLFWVLRCPARQTGTFQSHRRCTPGMFVCST